MTTFPYMLLACVLSCEGRSQAGCSADFVQISVIRTRGSMASIRVAEASASGDVAALTDATCSHRAARRPRVRRGGAGTQGVSAVRPVQRHVWPAIHRPSRAAAAWQQSPAPQPVAASSCRRSGNSPNARPRHRQNGACRAASPIPRFHRGGDSASLPQSPASSIPCGTAWARPVAPRACPSD